MDILKRYEPSDQAIDIHGAFDELLIDREMLRLLALRALEFVKGAAENTCCTCCDECLSCDAREFLSELKRSF